MLRMLLASVALIDGNKPHEAHQPSYMVPTTSRPVRFMYWAIWRDPYHGIQELFVDYRHKRRFSAFRRPADSKDATATAATVRIVYKSLQRPILYNIISGLAKVVTAFLGVKSQISVRASNSPVNDRVPMRPAGL